MALYHRFSVICFVLLFVYFTEADGNEAEKVFKDFEIVPDMLDVAPQELLKVSFNGLITGEGAEFTPTQTKDEPTLEWTVEPGAYYSVIMSNPDILTRANPTAREWLHWLVVNVPGMDVSKGEVLDPYIGPLTPKISGLCRYVFLVYKQPDKLVFDEPILNNTSVEGHEKFNSMKFSAKYKMGPPVAGNIFHSRWDELVPSLHAQFGIVI